MRTLLAPYLVFLAFLLSLLSLPGSQAFSATSRSPDEQVTQVPLVQTISIAFDLEQALMRGESTLTLPPGQEMRLFFGDLHQVRIMLREQGDGDRIDIEYNEKRAIAPNDDNSLFLAASGRQRTLFLSWQLTAVPPGHASGNLISPEGITLTGLWHPTAERDMLFSLTAALPSGFQGITEADELTLSAAEGLFDDELNDERSNEHLLKASYPHPLRSIHFAAASYVILSHQIRDGLVVSTYFFEEDAGLAQGYLDKTVEYIRRYEALLGSFPFKRYAVVENRLPTGYGMPGFTLLGQAVIRLPFIKDTSLGHEVLHSWFGNAIGNDANGNWCEGLTTLLADQSSAQDKGEGIQYRKNQLLNYQAYVGEDSLTSVFDFQDGADSQPMARKMRAIGYNKVSMLFHSLRQEIGEEAFFAALRQFYKEKKYQQAGWADLEFFFADASGKDLSAFFTQWLVRPDIPSLSVDQVTIEQEGGRSVVSFRLLQHTEAPYQLRIPIMIKTRLGTTREIVNLETSERQVSITVDSLPTALIIDPEYDLMRRLAEAESPPAWMRFMGAEKKTVVLPSLPPGNEGGGEQEGCYLPLTGELERWGCRLVRADALKNSDLGQGSVLFLGSSAASRSLFGSAEYGNEEETASGFTLDIRKNPLNQQEVMVLVSSESAAESERALAKLRHYGKYSRLRFVNGRIKEKYIAAADNGIRLPLLIPSAGIPVREIKTFSDIIDALAESKIIYVGETHSDFGSHLLQLQVIQALREKLEQAGAADRLVIGMEMFPRSSQHALDGYISGAVQTELDFLRRSAYYEVWGYDYRMYRDIMNYAKAYQIPVVGLNLNRKIVSAVFKEGSTDELTAEQLAEVAAERDLELPGYRQRLRKIHAMHEKTDKNGGFSGFIQAQSIWDETMAESIADYLGSHPEKKMIVLAGTGHVYKDSGVPPRVQRRMTESLSQSVLIANDGQQTGSEQGGRADYLMFTEDVQLPPAGTIGVLLEQEEKTEEHPAQVKISGISPLGKAGEAGLKKGDTLLAVDSASVSTIGELKTALIDKKPGEAVLLNIVRQEKVLRIKVELSDMDKPSMPPEHPKK